MNVSQQNEAEARLYNHTDRLLQGHQRLLSDTERNQSFYRALSGVIDNQSTVLDIGSGTGVWAITAALLGARRVVAVEYEPLLIGVIKALAEENGVADKIEVVLGDSRQVRLKKEFDVIVSETIGHLVFDESIVSIMIDARERFLKPGGILIPQTVSLVAAPAHLAKVDEKMPAGIPLAGSIFENISINIPLAMREKSGLKILSDPKTLIGADLRMIGELPDLNDMSAHWEMPETAEINCFAVWAEAALTEEVSFTTYRTTSWMPMIYRIKPFRQNGGELSFDLTLTEKSNYWCARLRGGGGEEEQSYSPAAAAAELVTRSRPYSKVLEHLKIEQN